MNIHHKLIFCLWLFAVLFQMSASTQNVSISTELMISHQSQLKEDEEVESRPPRSLSSISKEIDVAIVLHTAMGFTEENDWPRKIVLNLIPTLSSAFFDTWKVARVGLIIRHIAGANFSVIVNMTKSKQEFVRDFETKSYSAITNYVKGYEAARKLLSVSSAGKPQQAIVFILDDRLNMGQEEQLQDIQTIQQKLSYPPRLYTLWFHCSSNQFCGKNESTTRLSASKFTKLSYYARQVLPNSDLDDLAKALAFNMTGPEPTTTTLSTTTPTTTTQNTTTTDSAPAASSTALIGGIIGGVILLLVLIAIGILVWYFKCYKKKTKEKPKKKKKRKKHNSDDETEYTETSDTQGSSQNAAAPFQLQPQLGAPFGPYSANPHFYNYSTDGTSQEAQARLAEAMRIERAQMEKQGYLKLSVLGSLNENK